MTVASSLNGRGTRIGGEAPTNGADEMISMQVPYTARFVIEGTADLFFHRYNCESVEAKGKAKKGSKEKKTDDIESYVWRNPAGNICLPGEYVRMAMVYAAKNRQDPRSPRKSAHDLYKAALISLTGLASLGKDEWDYLDKRGACVERKRITRVRPAMLAGWRAEFEIMVNLPEYISPQQFHEVLTDAGKFQGVGDFRPTYGRFLVKSFCINGEE